ncbi:MAG: FAD:protein FMN transferase [Rhodoglobus sp.]
MRRTFETMGTVASVDGIDEPTLAAVRDIFTTADERFSLYRPDSELSRVASGELTLPECSVQVRDAYADALAFSSLTSGAFTPHRWDGVIDLNGIVKAQAMQKAGGLIHSSGCRDWSLNVGGDILVGGHAPHTTGIVDPFDSGTLLCAIDFIAPRVAMATSGSAERGDHIWLAGATGPAEYVQVSVVGNDIITADVLATAIVAGGRSALDEVTARWDVDVIAVARDGSMLATPGIRTALAA